MPAQMQTLYQEDMLGSDSHKLPCLQVAVLACRLRSSSLVENDMQPTAGALAVAERLKQLRLRIVFAESCTSGQLAATLGAVEGISDRLCGSAVSYRDSAKIDWLDVSDADISAFTAVSAPVAEEMARGVLQRTAEAHVAVATTGHLGPDAPPELDGVVFISVAQRSKEGIHVDVSRVQLESSSRGERQDEAVARAFACVQDSLDTCADPHALRGQPDGATGQPQHYSFAGSFAEHESILQAILNTAVDAIITIDAQGLIRMVNPSAERMFGFVADEMLGQNIRMLMPPPYYGEHNGYLRDYLATGNPKIIGIGREVVGQRKDGSTFPIDLAVSESIVGGRHHFTGVVRDLTERKIAEERVAGLGRIIEHSMNEIYIFDAETLQFVEVNLGARENLGYTFDQLAEMTPVDLKPDMTAAAFEQLIEPLRSKQEDSIDFETRHRRANGSFYDVEVHLQMSTFEQRDVFVAIILDVSERKQAETRMLQAERLAAIGQMIAGLAHESRNAFQRIQACLEMLELDLEGEHESLDLIRRAQKALDHLHYLYEEVRDYAAPLRLTKGAACLPDVWRETWSNLKLQRKGKQIDLVEDADEDLHVHVDRHALEQVFRNLFENGIAACPETGAIRVRQSQVELADGPAVSVVVTDTGPGFDEQTLAKVFDPFFTTKSKGTGLGMAITKRIVEAHGGTIAVGNCDQGAQVTIVIPLGAT